MTTTARGDLFEKRIYDNFEQMMLEGKFFARPECCRIFHRKGYFSKDRQKEIVFDVSIEIFLPGSDEPSLLVLIECKDYTGRIPVNDVEEFYAKVQQIAPAGVKAIVASTNSFQEGAFTYAKSKGIGLLRNFGPDSLEWILKRSPSSSPNSSRAESNAYYALRDEKFKASYFDYYCFIEDRYTASLLEFFRVLVGSVSVDEEFAATGTDFEGPSVPYLMHAQIEQQCREIRNGIGYSGGQVSLEDICALLKKTCGIRIERANLARGVLGTAGFSPPLIAIDYSQTQNDRQARFTLAHELGHILLGHGDYMLRDVCHQVDVEVENPPKLAVKDLMRMEWQANHFAACLLLPDDGLIAAVMDEAAFQGLVDRGHGLIYLDGQRCNFENYYRVTTPLVDRFNVSRSVIKIRLGELGILKNHLVEAKVAGARFPAIPAGG